MKAAHIATGQHALTIAFFQRPSRHFRRRIGIMAFVDDTNDIPSRLCRYLLCEPSDYLIVNARSAQLSQQQVKVLVVARDVVQFTSSAPLLEGIIADTP